MPRPAVLVVAVPRVCASALAFSLGQANEYDLYSPDVAAGEALPARRFDAVLSTVPVPGVVGDVMIELPQSFDRPVTVSVHDVTFPVKVSEHHPIQDVAGLLHRYLLDGERPPVEVSASTRGAGAAVQGSSAART